MARATAPTLADLESGATSIAAYFRRSPAYKEERASNQESTESRQSRYLEALRDSATITEACLVAGISRVTIWRWRDDYPDFAESVATILRSAQADYHEQLEHSIWRRALAGDTLLSMFVMKRLDQTYRDSFTAPVQTTARQSLRFMLDTERDDAIAGEYSTVPALPAPDSDTEPAE